MELKNRFERAAEQRLGFESQLYKNGVFFAKGGGAVWIAQARAKDSERYEDLQISGPSRAYLVGLLAEKLRGFQLVRPRTASDEVRDEMKQIKAEREAARKLAAEAEAQKPKPKPQIFGMSADSPEAQQIAQREAAAFVQSHANDSAFLASPFNMRNLQTRVTELWERGEITNPTAEVYEHCWGWLKERGYIEEPTRKRGAPAKRIYYPQPVAPKPTQEQIAAQQRAAILEERRKLQQMPFEELQKLYESQKGRTRKAAFSVNR